MSLTRNEQQTLVKLLDKLVAPYSPDVFYALCRNMIMLPIEIIPLTRDREVLMFRRPPNDPHYSNLWHTPGGIQTKGQTPEDVLKRLLTKDELASTKCTEPRFLFNASNKHGINRGEAARGQEEAKVFFVWVNKAEYGGVGTFFKLSDIPEDTFEPHKIFLEKINTEFNDLLQ